MVCICCFCRIGRNHLFNDINQNRIKVYSFHVLKKESRHQWICVCDALMNRPVPGYGCYVWLQKEVKTIFCNNGYYPSLRCMRWKLPISAVLVDIASECSVHCFSKRFACDDGKATRKINNILLLHWAVVKLSCIHAASIKMLTSKISVLMAEKATFSVMVVVGLAIYRYFPNSLLRENPARWSRHLFGYIHLCQLVCRLVGSAGIDLSCQSPFLHPCHHQCRHILSLCRWRQARPTLASSPTLVIEQENLLVPCWYQILVVFCCSIKQ